MVFLHRDVVPFLGVGERRADVWDLEGDGGFYRQGEFSEFRGWSMRKEKQDPSPLIRTLPCVVWPQIASPCLASGWLDAQQVVTLNAQKRRLRIDFTSPASDAGMYKVESFMRRQAESLLLELDVWHNGLSTLSQHVRVDCGDYIYKYMCCVYILGEVSELSLKQGDEGFVKYTVS